MKKTAALLLTIIMLLSVSACTGGSRGNAYKSSTATDISEQEIQQLIDEAAKNAEANAAPSAGVQ